MFTFKSLVSSTAPGTQDMLRWLYGDSHVLLDSKEHRVQNGFVISLPSPPNPLLPERFPFLFIKDPSSQLQRSKSPQEYCTLMERAVIVVRLFWARILALATTGCPVWMSCLPLLSVSFPFHQRRMTIHSIHPFSKCLLGP